MMVLFKVPSFALHVMLRFFILSPEVAILQFPILLSACELGFFLFCFPFFAISLLL